MRVISAGSISVRLFNLHLGNNWPEGYLGGNLIK